MGSVAGPRTHAADFRGSVVPFLRSRRDLYEGSVDRAREALLEARFLSQRLAPRDWVVFTAVVAMSGLDEAALEQGRARPVSAREVADFTGLRLTDAQKTLRKLAEDELLIDDLDGVWSI